MAPTVCCLRERSRALGALEGFLPTVRSHVVFHVGHVRRSVRAEDAQQRLSTLGSLPSPNVGAFTGVPDDLAKLAWLVRFSRACLFDILPHRPPLEK